VSAEFKAVAHKCVAIWACGIRPSEKVVAEMQTKTSMASFGRKSAPPGQVAMSAVVATIAKSLSARGIPPVSTVKVGKEVGRGRFKCVYQGLLQRERGGEAQDVVVLQYRTSDSNSRELEVLGYLIKKVWESPYLPKVFGATSGPNGTTVVQERALWGTLKSTLADEQSASKLTPLHRVYAAKQLAEGMQVLASVGVVHADLACRNVLLFVLDDDASKVAAKVTDFGLAVILRPGATSEVRKQPQATRWCAPEAIARNELSQASDVWSFAVTLWELLSGGATPWKFREKRASVAARLMDLAEPGGKAEGSQDMTADFPPIPGYPRPLHEVMLSCMSVEAGKRPSFSALPAVLARIAQDHARELREGVSQAAADDGRPHVPVKVQSLAEWFSQLRQEHAVGEAALASWNVFGGGAEAGSTPIRKSVPQVQQQLWLAGLQSFLFSGHASQLLGETTVKEMRSEIVLPSVVEACLRQNVDAMQTNHVVNRGHILHDIIVPLLPLGAPMVASSAPSRIGLWTLWSLMTPGLLRRQNFVDENSAKAAFVGAFPEPSMLRCPSGKEVAARSWTKLVQPEGPEEDGDAMPADKKV